MEHRLSTGWRRAAAVLSMATGLVLTAAVTPAQAKPTLTHYISFVDYYSDATYTQLVGSRTWNDCPGEQGTYGWGLQTSYHVTTYEECP